MPFIIEEPEEKGISMDPSGQQSYRNNNIWNTEYRPWQEAYGGTRAPEGRFTKYPTMEASVAATSDLIRKNYANLSIAEGIEKFAPTWQNKNTPERIKATAAHFGVGPDTKIGDLPLGPFMTFQAKYESPTKIDPAVFGDNYHIPIRLTGSMETRASKIGSTKQGRYLIEEPPEEGSIVIQEPTTPPPPAATQEVPPGTVMGAGVPGQGPQAGPQESMGQTVAKTVMPLVKPALQYGGAALGGIIGSAAGPVGTVAGGTLGYGIGSQAAKAIEQGTGIAKPQELGPALKGVGEDLQTGAMVSLGGEIGGALLPKIAAPVANWVKNRLSPGIYESALKIPPSVPENIRRRAIQTGIEGKYLPKASTLENLNGEMTSLNREILNLIDRGAAQGLEVDTAKVLSRVDELGKFYENLPDPRPYMEQLSAAKAAILEYRGQKIPVDVAQQMKKNLYTNLRKAYGEMKSIGKEFDKSVARGIKEELETQLPELQRLNQEMSDKINLQTILERSVHRIRNYDVIRLGDTVAAAGGAAAAGPEGLGIGFLVKRVLEAPTVKARISFALSKAGKLTGESLAKPTGYVVGKSLGPDESK